MTKRRIIGAQGEVNIFAIEAPPAGQTRPATDRDPAGRVIISHSESGHHHVLTGGEVLERVSGGADGVAQFYAIFTKAEKLMQTSPAPHEDFELEPGQWFEFVISRAFDPFAAQARRVCD